MKRILLMIVILSALTSQMFGRLGGAGANFLEIGSGGRALALSGAFTALSADIDAIYCNPAGITSLTQTAIGFSYTPYFADMSFQTLSAVVPLGSFGNIGLSFQTLQSGSIEITTLEEQDGNGFKYNANDYALGITFARKLTDKFTAGGTFKIINQNLDQVSATGWAIDIGSTYNTGWKNLRFGFSILNFGPDMQYKGDALLFRSKPQDPNSPEENDLMAEDALAQWESEKYQLPLIFQIGIAYDVFNTDFYRFTVTFDKVNLTDQNETFAAGSEFAFKDMIFLRAGYSEKNNKNLTAGAGIKLDMGNSKAIIDYTYQNHKYLDPLHTFSLGFVF